LLRIVVSILVLIVVDKDRDDDRDEDGGTTTIGTTIRTKMDGRTPIKPPPVKQIQPIAAKRGSG
jgi:hypothetical protein